MVIIITVLRVFIKYIIKEFFQHWVLNLCLLYIGFLLFRTLVMSGITKFDYILTPIIKIKSTSTLYESDTNIQ